MKSIILLSLTSAIFLFSCNKENTTPEKSKTEVENAAIKNKTQNLDSIFHINAVSKLPNYAKVEVDSMKVLSVIPIHGKDFRKNLKKPDFELDLKNIESIKKLEKHIAENTDKNKPVIGYVTVLTYTTNLKKETNLSIDQQKEFDKMENVINRKNETFYYLNSDLRPQNILTLEL